jgi:HEAT repeat protein/TolA-binding protein
MNRITLAVLTAALAASATTIVRAQDPVPPTPPARPARPERPTRAPRAAPVPRLDLDFPSDMIAPMAIDIDQDAMREALRSATDAMRSVDMDQIREQVRDAQRATDAMKLNQEAFRNLGDFQNFAPLASLAQIKVMGQDAASGFSYRRDPLDRQPPAPWAQGDPADSVYRVAREALNRGDYGRAAEMFAEISQKYPKSVYQPNAVYFEALARYKVGTTDELKAAARALEPLASKATGSTNTNVSWDGQRRSMNESEIVALYTRINGALAQRGDRDAAAKVEKVASQNGGAACDQEDMQVKAEALNALSQMDPAGSLKILRSVLDRHDACTAPLRRNAIFILGRRGDAESSSLIASVAKSDPDVNVRSEAINFLAKQQGDAGVAALEDILRTDQDERIQRAAMRSLMSSDNPKARSSIRALIERKDAPIGLRVQAVNSFNSDRSTADDAAYLRGYYAKADNDRLRDAIIDALARIGGAENERWLLTVASNQNESSQLRSSAVSHLYRSQSLSVADLSKLYDSAESYGLRSQIIQVLQQRKEPEATDKLIDIVKNSTDINIRRQALSAVTHKNDPRGAQLLMEIIDGKKP